MSSISVDAIDFRAPPPSPVAQGSRSTVENDDVLSEFLEHSLRLPDQLLPDRVFPRQKNVGKPPLLDLESLESDGSESIWGSIGQMGCFEILNHGIAMDMIRSVIEFSGGIFGISSERKAIVSRSSARPYGFVDLFEQEDRQVSEEFVWCREEAMKLEMEGVWPLHYSNFSCKVEKLLSEIEKIGAKLIQALEKKLKRKWAYEYDHAHGSRRKEQELVGSICYFYKHRRNLSSDDDDHQLKYDAVRMLILGSEHSHALCFYTCDGSSNFHVYSKKGWVSFCPDNSALVVTIGDQLQAWSDGQYKHVIGRPIFNNEDEDLSNISMAFVYSPPTKDTINISFAKGGAQERIITIGQQVFFALLISVFCHFFI